MGTGSSFVPTRTATGDAGVHEPFLGMWTMICDAFVQTAGVRETSGRFNVGNDRDACTQALV